MELRWHHWLDEIIRRAEGPAGRGAGLLFVTVIISALIVFFRSDHPRTLRGFITFALPEKILRHPSARTDFLFWITNRLIMLPLALPAGITVAATIGYAVNKALVSIFGVAPQPTHDPGLLTLLLFTLSMLLTYDVAYYFYHLLQHRVPILWELHKVHHSAEVMVGTTRDRVHPVDVIMNKVWDGLATGPLYGLWLFFVFDPVELTVLGINIYMLRAVIMMDFVRHTHLKISFGPVVNAVLLCPHYHQLHHSVDPKHYDRNFGLMLTIWDRMFGTLAVPKPDESFEFGLSNREAEEYRSLRGLYLLPLQRMAQLIPIGRHRRPRTDP